MKNDLISYPTADVFLQVATFFQIKSVFFGRLRAKAAACTFYHHISCWHDNSHKHNKAHVAVSINANSASILRVLLNATQHGGHFYTA